MKPTYLEVYRSRQYIHYSVPNQGVKLPLSVKPYSNKNTCVAYTMGDYFRWNDPKIGQLIVDDFFLDTFNEKIGKVINIFKSANFLKVMSI